MNMPIQHEYTDEACRFVEVLTSETTGLPIGYCLGGGSPGPNVLAVGHSPLMDVVFERLSLLPTLPWMWGKLYLVTLDALDDGNITDARKAIPETPFDEIIMLPFSTFEGSDEKTADQSYWSVLKLCAGLGMIAGRGMRSTY